MFKVGDKGRTRGGESYEVIAVEPRAKYYTLAVFFHDREIILMRSAAGRVNAADRPHQSGDLLPPTCTKYVNLAAVTFRGEPSIASSQLFDSADDARSKACATDVRYAAIAVPVEMPA